MNLTAGFMALFWTTPWLLPLAAVANFPLCLGASFFAFPHPRWVDRLVNGGYAWVRSLLIFLLVDVVLLLSTSGAILFSKYGPFAFLTACLLSAAGGILVQRARNGKC